MDIKRVREEMQFITGVVTNDIDYLFYLMLKKPLIEKEKSVKLSKSSDEYFDEKDFEDWFDSL